MKKYSESQWKYTLPLVDAMFKVNLEGLFTHALHNDTLPVGYAAGARADGHPIVSGGLGKDGFPTAESFIIDESCHCSTTCPLPFPLYGHSMTQTDNGEIFVGGGVKVASDGGLELCPDVLRYSLKNDRWEFIARLPWRSARLVCEYVNGSIYFIAGDTATTHHPEKPFAPAICRDTVQILNLSSGKWSEGAPKPTPETGVTSAVKGDKIYVVSSVGGDGTISDIVEVYSVTTDSWSSIPSMPTPRTNVPCGFVDNKLYCINGLGRGLTPLSLIECYDLDTGVWSKENTSLPPFHASSVISLTDNEFVIIGGIQ